MILSVVDAVTLLVGAVIMKNARIAAQSLCGLRVTMTRICETCIHWRDYTVDIESHLDYDGHCPFRSIMTLNVSECEDYNRTFTKEEVELMKQRLRELGQKEKPNYGNSYVPNPWDDWKRKQHLKGLYYEND